MNTLLENESLAHEYQVGKKRQLPSTLLPLEMLPELCFTPVEPWLCFQADLLDTQSFLVLHLLFSLLLLLSCDCSRKRQRTLLLKATHL